MGIDQQTATTILAYETRGSETVLLANQTVIDSMESVAATGTDITLPFDDFASTVSQAIIPMEDLATATKEAADQSERLAAANDGGGGGGFNITGSRRGLTALGSLAGGSPVLSDAARLVSTTAAFGGVGAVLGVAAIAAKAFTDEVSRETAVETQRLDVERQAAHEVTTLTSQQAQAKIDAAKASLAIDQTVNDTLQQSFNDYQDTILAFPLKASAAFAGLDPTYNAYADALAKGSVAVEGEQATIDALTGSMDKGATAAADQAAANKLLADQLVTNSNQILEVDKLTTEQRNTRAEQDRRDISLLNDQITAGGLTADATFALSQQQEKLYTDYQAVTSVSTTYAQQLLDEKAAKDALTKQSLSYLDEITAEVTTRGQIADIETKIGDLRTAAATKEAQDAAATATKINSLEVEAGDKRAEIVQTGLDDVARITRDSLRAEGSAIKNRDSVAFDQARTQFQDKLTDEQKAQTKSLTQLTVSLKKQEDAERTAGIARNKATEDSLRTELSTQNQALMAQRTNLQNELTSEVALSTNYGVGIVSAHEYMLQGIQSTVLSYGVSIVTGLNNIFNSFAPLPLPANGYGSQGAMTTAKVQNIVRQQVAGYIGAKYGG